jgi:hypothetical protein
MRDEKIFADERMGYAVTYPMDFFLIFITTIGVKLLLLGLKLLRLWLKLPQLGVSHSYFSSSLILNFIDDRDRVHP